MATYYTPHMALVNRGGLTFVNNKFFKRGRLVLSSIRKAFDVDVIERDPKNAFHNSKQKIMEDSGLKNYFISLCKQQSMCTVIASDVYDVFLRKTIHARFAVVWRHWKEANIKKNGQVAFRTKLKEQSGIKRKAECGEASAELSKKMRQGGWEGFTGAAVL